VGNESGPDELMAQAVRWLARREYSVHELGQRLTGKGYPSEDVAAALEALS
jgi:SOS response regulatory protein OraA/RecX